MATATAFANRVAVPSLQGSRREAVLDDLNNSLADMIDLAASAKQAHWNVYGPNFQGLHELFDTIAAESRAWSDLLAERCAAMGGTADGTVQAVTERSQLPAFPRKERHWMRLCEGMHDRMLMAAERMRGVAGALDDDLVTQDLYIEILRGLEMRAWMVEAHLRNVDGAEMNGH